MSAIISNCGQYRYRLDRPGDFTATRGPAVFIMLNPSTADATTDDRTIGRCRAFAQAWGCNGLVVANLYAFRATRPADLWLAPDPVGPENDEYLLQVAAEAGQIVCAWGADARADRVAAVTSMLVDAGAVLRCLGTTKLTGAPRHPLYVRGDQPLIDYLGVHLKKETPP
jgi:hypothetical protein